MTRNFKLYFLGYFIYFPFIFIISFIIWMYLIRNHDLWTVFSDCTSIIGLYYLMTSVVFTLVFINSVSKEKD
ncbi:TRAP-type mannitol/chloroaromatic compound transport system permease small subunit [Metabacillus malikii]|uniref:TRAP-type mannitol/chloroaromatic compound transport system permease small subunit n=1 Tax=Metabacillus malikii TaxID=1504265 RepID=A0ABT9ZCZ8_9BACI|nr:TRAP-type mannitol/chloroaromatic compound transport system permease small subunit [Metabacillus malikii]